MEIKLNIHTQSPEQTQAVGQLIGEYAQEGDIFLLSGELGTGKTCLTQGIAVGLGVPGYVRSPTFVLMTQYQGRLRLHHIDLYRLEGSFQAWDLGIEEQLTSNEVCVVEWADRAPDIFPDECLWIDLIHTQHSNSRNISFYSQSTKYEPIITKLRQINFGIERN